MAKRKRLSPAAASPETSKTPATAAALDEITDELRNAKAGGRMVVPLRFDAIDARYLVRDRMEMESDAFETLKESLRTRGQQTPIEVVDLGDGRYGLISGWRRLSALQALHAETKAPEFAEIQALIRAPDASSDAYLAMVEENEVRANISFYERARIAHCAAEAGVFTDARTAVKALFASAPRAKRSKINTFIALYEALGDTLQFPNALSEKQGLTLAKAVSETPELGITMLDGLLTHRPDTPEAELAVLQVAITGRKTESIQAQIDGIPDGQHGGKPVYLRLSKGKLVLDGEGVTPALEAELRAWLAAQR